MTESHPRYINQNQVEVIYGVPIEKLAKIGIRPVEEVSSPKRKRYDTKAIDKRLDELSGLAKNEVREEFDWNAELIKRAQDGKSAY